MEQRKRAPQWKRFVFFTQGKTPVQRIFRVRSSVFEGHALAKRLLETLRVTEPASEFFWHQVHALECTLYGIATRWTLDEGALEELFGHVMEKQLAARFAAEFYEADEVVPYSLSFGLLEDRSEDIRLETCAPPDCVTDTVSFDYPKSFAESVTVMSEGDFVLCS
jgi:hypothetical protein